MKHALLGLLALASSSIAAPLAAAALVPVPASLNDKAGAVCIKVSPKGTVSDVFIIQSTGDGLADADMVDWIRTLSWPVAKPGDTTRKTWQPLPVAMGKATPPELPESCAPPKAKR